MGALDLDWSTRQLTTVVREDPTSAELGELVSCEVSCWVAHDALHLIGMNPVSGTVSFGFWHQYPRDLAYAEMRNCYLGDDPLRPVDLARQQVPVGIVRADRRQWSELWAREILAAHGVGCELRLLLRDTRGVWGMLCLFREQGGRPFAKDDADRLVQLTPTLIAMLRAYVRAGPLRLRRPDLRPGVIVVGADHGIRGVTAEAHVWLYELRMSEWLSSPEWAAMALASEVSQTTRPRPSDPSAPHPLICVPAAYIGRWVALQAQPLQESDTADVAVIIQAANGELLLPTFSAWYGLTPRERSIVEHLRTGMAPKQIARRLKLSPHTINDHLKSVFRKTNTSGRDELTVAVGA